MQALELYAGTRSVGKILESKGIRVFSLDNDKTHKCELTMDILNFEPGAFEHISPDIIWASIDCTTFSYASGSFYRDKNGAAKNKKAILGDILLEHTLKLIEIYLEKNKKIKYYIENPRGHMAKQKVIIDFLARTNGNEKFITYCSYGYEYRKPTYIFTNDKDWIPKRRCGYKTRQGNGNDCIHKNCPRGYHKGICEIGRAGDKKRSIIPEGLILDIFKNI